jgi:hypothetical protein
MAHPDCRLIPMPEQKDLPPGPTWQCDTCGERVRTGQPHTALVPWPHQSYAALIVTMTREELEREDTGPVLPLVAA